VTPSSVLACYTTRADLVIIGRHGAPGSRPAIGGIQHALLNHARGPVAIVPAGLDLNSSGTQGPEPGFTSLSGNRRDH
jgi:hypothetical protein